MQLNLSISGRPAGAWLNEAIALIDAQKGAPRAAAMAERIKTEAKIGALFVQDFEAGQVVIRPSARARALILEMRQWPRD